MAEIDRPSGFPRAAARERFLAAYEAALSRLWPVEVRAQDVPTPAGPLR